MSQVIIIIIKRNCLLWRHKKPVHHGQVSGLWTAQFSQFQLLPAPVLFLLRPLGSRGGVDCCLTLTPPLPQHLGAVCLRVSARPSEQQPGPVSDVHGLVPLAALPHQHWHHVLHVRVLPGRRGRPARRWRRGRRGGWGGVGGGGRGGGRGGGGGAAGRPDGEPRTLAAGRGEELREEMAAELW